jgi:hypothetical protein
MVVSPYAVSISGFIAGELGALYALSAALSATTSPSNSEDPVLDAWLGLPA